MKLYFQETHLISFIFINWLLSIGVISGIGIRFEKNKNEAPHHHYNFMLCFNCRQLRWVFKCNSQIDDLLK